MVYQLIVSITTLLTANNVLLACDKIVNVYPPVNQRAQEGNKIGEKEREKERRYGRISGRIEEDI